MAKDNLGPTTSVTIETIIIMLNTNRGSGLGTIFNPSFSNQFTVCFVHFPLAEVSAMPHVVIGNKLSWRLASSLAYSFIHHVLGPFDHV